MIRRRFTPALLRLAWPVALSRLGIMGMGVTDVIIVGQLAPHQLSHQALGWAPTGVALVAGLGLLTGVQVLAARAIGERNPAAAGGAWRRGLVVGVGAGAAAGVLLFFFGELLLRSLGIGAALAAGAGAVLSVLAFSIPFHLANTANTSFLEAIQRPMPATVAMWLANIVNIALNLLWVPEYGAVGSAMATVSARFLLALGTGLWIWFLPDADKLGVRTGASGPTYNALLAIGAAAMVSQIAEAGAFSAMTVIAGRISEDAVASYQILLNVLAVQFMIAMGMSTATAVLVSEAIGRGARHEAVRAGWTGLSLNSLAMAAGGVLVLLLAMPIGRAFTANLEVAALVAATMPLAALILVPDGGQVVAAQALRARGDNWFPTASHVLAYVFVMPPLAFLLAERGGHGVQGLILAIFWASVLSFGVLVLRFWVLGRRDALAPAAAAAAE